jgi:hypothetical protein
VKITRIQVRVFFFERPISVVKLLAGCAGSANKYWPGDQLS